MYLTVCNMKAKANKKLWRTLWFNLPIKNGDYFATLNNQRVTRWYLYTNRGCPWLSTIQCELQVLAVWDHVAGTPAIRRSLEERSVGLSVNQWPCKVGPPWPRNRAKLVNITPISVWLMILIISYKYRIYRELLNPLVTSRGPIPLNSVRSHGFV